MITQSKKHQHLHPTLPYPTVQDNYPTLLSPCLCSTPYSYLALPSLTFLYPILSYPTSTLPYPFSTLLYQKQLTFFTYTSMKGHLLENFQERNLSQIAFPSLQIFSRNSHPNATGPSAFSRFDWLTEKLIGTTKIWLNCHQTLFLF